ncbi:PKD-like family lipoprotein [Mangrovibacterium marinum]|uniref:PKD family protein n=1 Tax=Mangrovibacterium marinum TaxID=1639118 RepID=A0A2T5BXQ9_9BACT|nr:PKD-like family lipoprotein [Mangrovibacterium marinum]PTN05926.1 PKD family protein [Mangrovibacterium marinum]
MRKLFFAILLTLAIAALVPSCYKDHGNYDYIDADELAIDTTGVTKASPYFTVHLGDTIKVNPMVDYAHPENLSYTWFLLPFPYETEIVGNTTQYPAPDTIAHTLDLDWIVDVEPGGYRYYLEVKDTVLGLSDNIYPNHSNYLNVVSASSFYGLMCLTEYDGNTDIDIYYTPLALIFSAETKQHFYSEKTGSMIPGSPSTFGYCSKGYYYAFTNQEGRRLDKNDFLTMENFDEMFYSAPSLNAREYQYVKNQELLVNDGKLHVINNNLSNDRKFSSAISGDYEAFPYITQKGYSNSSGAACVIFDEESKSFMRYYTGGTSFSKYGAASAGAYVDARNLPSLPLAMFTYNGDYTGVVLRDEDGKMALWLYNLWASDDSDLSGNGSRSKIDLSACEDIENATMFYAESSGTTFHYATDKAIYGFSITSGETTSNKVYDLPEGDEVTAMYSIPAKGFPTGGRVYWFATWNEASKNGKIVECEIDPYSGKLDWFWGMMFGLPGPNPSVTEGYGKIVRMKVGI